MTQQCQRLHFDLIKDTPYLALTGKLWGACCEHFKENWWLLIVTSWPLDVSWMIHGWEPWVHRCIIHQHKRDNTDLALSTGIWWCVESITWNRNKYDLSIIIMSPELSIWFILSCWEECIRKLFFISEYHCFVSTHWGLNSTSMLFDSSESHE